MDIEKGSFDERSCKKGRNFNTLTSLPTAAGREVKEGEKNDRCLNCGEAELERERGSF